MTAQAKIFSDPDRTLELMNGRNILEAAKRLKDASPEELQLIAAHDWDMIREVAAVLFANMTAVKSSTI